jgi:hypothetical protein
MAVNEAFKEFSIEGKGAVIIGAELPLGGAAAQILAEAEQRLLKPEELGGALLYLVSPAAAYVTGQSIAIDGGLLCRV